MRINSTTKPIRFRTWHTRAELVTQNHFVVLKSHNIKARCILDAETLTAANGRQYQYGGQSAAEFETTCEEQDVVLQLLYGNNLKLLEEELVLPNTYSVCTLEK